MKIFYTVDALLLLGYAAVGSIPAAVGVLYGLAGGFAAVVFHAFWRRGGRVDEAHRLTVVQTVLAASVMLTALVGEPKVGGPMLMSLTAVLSLTAITFRGRGLLGLSLAVSIACVAILGFSDVQPRFPAETPAERALTGAWLALLMLKATAQSVSGRQLRAMVDQSNARLAQALREVEKLAATDDLTGLPNRRSILDRLQRSLDPTRGDPGPPAVALIDIDLFKTINDRFGHDVGDRVLHRFGDVLAASLRPVDAVGRYGGEEFLLVLATPPDVRAAAEIADRVRAQIAAHDWSGLVPGLAVTASVGVAMVESGDSAGDATRRADAALY